MSLPVQANTRDAVLTLLLEQGEAEAGDLARTQGISVQAMRRQLRSLAEAGLVEASTSADGPGRPSNRWRLTNHGRRRFPVAPPPPRPAPQARQARSSGCRR